MYDYLSDNPTALWPLNGVGVDVTENGHDASGSLTPIEPIMAGGIGASIGDLTFPVSVGLHNGPFTLEAWIKPIIGGTYWIWKRDQSGVRVEDSTVEFRMNFPTMQTISFDYITVGDIFHIVATYDGSGMGLYVNGTFVGREQVSEDNLRFGIDDTSSLTSIDNTVAKIGKDSFAVYDHVLSRDQVVAHYLSGTDYYPVENLLQSSSASTFQFYDDASSIIYMKRFITDEDWLSGITTGPALFSGGIITMEGESGYESVQYTNAVLFDENVGQIGGSKIHWRTSDPSITTVEVSLDGTTWTAVANGEQPPLLSNGTDASDLNLLIRVTIAASDHQTTFDDLTIVVYKDKSVRGSNEEFVSSLVSPDGIKIANEAYPVASFSDNLGAKVSAGSGIVITPDPEFATYRTIEMVVKIGGLVPSKFLVSGSSINMWTNTVPAWQSTGFSNMYVNGVSSTNPASGRWVHIVGVLSSDKQESLTFGGVNGLAMQIGYLAFHDRVITSIEAQILYNAYVGAPSIAISNLSTIGLSNGTYAETSSPVRGYALDWSISPAG